MRHLNEDASSSNLPFYYNNNDERALTNGQYHPPYGFMSRSLTDSNHIHEKDTVKQRMIEHEAVFKNQVLELHRLYVIQRGLMMEDAKRKEPMTHWLLPSKENYGYARTSVSTTDIFNSPLASSKGNTIQFDGVCSSGYRPSKFPKKLPFDLELPAENYIDLEVEEHLSRHPVDNGLCNKASSTQHNSVKKFFPDGHEAADLNQPARLDCTNHTDFKSLTVNPFLASTSEGILKFHHGSSNGFSNHLSMESHGKERELLHCSTYEAGHIKSNLTQPADGLERNLSQMHSHGIRGDWWLEKKGGLQNSEKVHNNVFGKPIENSMFSTSSPHLVNSSQCANSRSHSASPWGKLSSSLTHNASPSFHKNPRCDVPLGDVFASDFSDNIKTSVGDYHSSSTNWYNKFLVSSNVIHSKPPRDLDLNKVAMSEEDVETSTIDSSGEGKARNEKKNAIMIDINVACELSPEQLVTEREGSDFNPSRKRKVFDLNSCVTEEEDDTLVPSIVASNDNINNDNVKTVLDIDWEAPFVLDSEEEDNPPTTMQTDDHGAADAIVALSTETKCENPPEEPPAETLRWFAGIVATSSAKERRGCPSYDSFEMMTLQLTETQEEEYMPRNPFYIPNPENLEGDGEESVGARTRRRGRQRRDFQREILPSLTSLSRHEVSQDFQTFGRLLSHCSSGWSRRSGTRKRRWDLEEEEEEEEEERDKRLTTGWGKTTRRRRRQRCPPVIPGPLTT